MALNHQNRQRRAAGRATRLLAVGLAVALTLVNETITRAATFGDAGHFGGTGNDQGFGVVRDGQGNVVLTGVFSGTADVDPGPGTQTLTGTGTLDALTVKLSPVGGLSWAAAFSGLEVVQGTSLAADAAGNVYVTGSFQSSVDFDPGPNQSIFFNAGSTDPFIAKLTPDGSLLWAATVRGASTDGALDVAVDSTGNVFLTGLFSGTADFDPSASVRNVSSQGSFDVFVLSLTTNGSFRFVVTFGAADADAGYGLALDADDNLYVVGSFGATVDLAPLGSPGTELTSAGGTDGFLMKLDRDGGLVWARRFGGSDDDVATDVTVDASGNVYVAGYFDGAADPGASSGAPALSSAGGRDALLMKLSPDGRPIWVDTFGGALTDEATAVSVDSAGNAYLAGFFEGASDLDPGPASASLTSAGSEDGFAAKLDADGRLVWAHRFGGTDLEPVRGVISDDRGNVTLVGLFSGAADFDPGLDTATLTSAGGFDGFVVRLVQASPPTNLVPAAQTTPEDTPLVFRSTSANPVTIADADNGSSPLTVTLAASNGTLTLGSTAGLSFSIGDGAADPTVTFVGTLTAINAALNGLAFTPTAQFSGPATLQVTTLDRLGPTGGQTDVDTVAIVVTPVDDAPAAVADTYTVANGRVLSVSAPGVLANDTDVESGPSLQALLNTGPAHGTVNFAPDGGFTYTPGASFVGTDSFTYRATDGTTVSAPASVTIAVTASRCVPKPRVAVRATPGGGRLQVTVEATPAPTGEANLLREIQFGQFQNARVTLNGQAVASGQTVTTPNGTVSMSLVVERQTAGQPTTVPLTVVDSCGAWPTFVGGGTAAGF